MDIDGNTYTIFQERFSENIGSLVDDLFFNRPTLVLYQVGGVLLKLFNKNVRVGESPNILLTDIYFQRDRYYCKINMCNNVINLVNTVPNPGISAEASSNVKVPLLEEDIIIFVNNFCYPN